METERTNKRRKTTRSRSTRDTDRYLIIKKERTEGEGEEEEEGRKKIHFVPT